MLLSPDTGKAESACFGCSQCQAGKCGPHGSCKGNHRVFQLLQAGLFYRLKAQQYKTCEIQDDPEQIVQAAKAALRVHKFGTFVLQSGEDPGYPADALAYVVRAIKQLGSAVTLSVGQRPYEDYELWRKAGADRFLLKFETSDPYLFKELNPSTTLDERLECLMNLRKLGYQIGTGIILGLPGQTREMVIGDLILLKQLDPEMVSIGRFIPHPDTPLGKSFPGANADLDPENLVRSTWRTVALGRLMVPLAHIPATTALGVIGKGSRGWVDWAKEYVMEIFGEMAGEMAGDKGGSAFQELTRHWKDPRAVALTCGANVIMPDVTPKVFRDSWRYIPATGSDGDELAGTVESIRAMLRSLGMSIDPGRGDSPKPWFASANGAS